MSSITLQFCAFDCWQDRLIQWFSAGRVGHVDIVMPDGQLLGAQHDSGMGGQPSGVYIRAADYGSSWKMKNRIRVAISCTPDHEQAFYAFARRQIGKTYDTKAIFGFIFGEDWRDDEAWFCSELAARALEVSGITGQLAAHANKITPQELLLVTSALGNVTHIKDEVK